MKKLLVLVVMLAMIVSANAMELRIYVDGSAPVGDIAATAGQQFTLSIYSMGFVNGEGNMFGLVAAPAVGVLGGGVITAAAPDASGMLDIADFAGLFPVDAGIAFGVDTYQAVTIANPNAGNMPAGTYVGSISFVVAGSGAVQLYSTDGSSSNLLGSQVFNVIPEPITVALLGLGGLFIRRRKVA